MRKEIWVNSYHLRDYNSVCGNVGRRSWPTSVAALNLIRRYVHAFVGAYKRALAIQITSGCLLTRLELFLCLSFWHLVTSSQAAWQRVIIDASLWLYAMSTWLTMIYTYISQICENNFEKAIDRLVWKFWGSVSIWSNSKIKKTNDIWCN